MSVHLCGRPSRHNRQPGQAGLRPDSDDVGSGPVPGLRVVVIVVPVVPVQAGGVDQGGQGQSHLPLPSQIWKVQTRRVGDMSANGIKGRTECGQVRNVAVDMLLKRCGGSIILCILYNISSLFYISLFCTKILIEFYYKL